MMVGLTNVLIKPIKKAGNGFIINLRNIKYEDEGDAIYWDLLHHSTTNFSLTFMDAIRKAETDKEKGSKVSLISVKVNYESIKTDAQKDKLCSKTFSHLGVTDTITY